jgi:hypothetical protein
MSRTGRAIGDAAFGARKGGSDLEDSQLKAPDFGRHTDHQGKAQAYLAGLKQMSTGAEAYCDALLAVSDKLDTSKKAYIRTDSDNAAGLR